MLQDPRVQRLLEVMDAMADLLAGHSYVELADRIRLAAVRIRRGDRYGLQEFINCGGKEGIDDVQFYGNEPSSKAELEELQRTFDALTAEAWGLVEALRKQYRSPIDRLADLLGR